MKIGIIGAGQLGLMIAEAAYQMRHECMFLDPSEDAPAIQMCGGIVAEFDDVEALERLCQWADVVTYEFENISAEVLEPLCAKYNIKQGCSSLLDSQDRVREKSNARDNGLSVQRFYAVGSDGEIGIKEAVAEIGLPVVVKSRRFGYDGKGQMVLREMADLESAELAELLQVPCIIEEFVDYDYEVSVITVRSQDSATVFPIGRNIHKDGILDLCTIPAQEMSEELRQRMERATVEFMERCGYYGILTIEFFVKGDEFIFNEMAPRPHNSGHYTIEGCLRGSQYSELVRFLTDEPLMGSELITKSVVMKNILGDDIEFARRVERKNMDGCVVHMYGKSESKPRRKMGHITFVGMDLDGYYYIEDKVNNPMFS